MSTFNDITQPRAAKVHRCEWCGELIEKGVIHVKFVGMFDGDFQTWRMHSNCYAYNCDAISDGFMPYEGMRA